jgi:glycerophosphoryl diester phosphodiesterase
LSGRINEKEILKAMISIKSNKNIKTPWIIGHRGYHAKYPENTMVSFEAAIKAGADMIELDVMLSRDRKVVVIHDAILARTTNGNGSVADFTLTELKQLDAGSWLDAQFSDQQIPELSEVLDLVNGRAYVNIEIKLNSYEPHHPPDAIEKQVVGLMGQKNLLDTGMISSFDVNILEQIAFMQKPPATAFISKKPANKKTVHMCTRLNVFSWHPDHLIVTRNQVKQMHAAGIKVFPYNVNTFEDYSWMRDMKVDGVITNDPVLVADWSKIRKAA